MRYMDLPAVFSVLPFANVASLAALSSVARAGSCDPHESGYEQLQHWLPD